MHDRPPPVLYPVGRSPMLVRWLIATCAFALVATLSSVFLVGVTANSAFRCVLYGLFVAAACGGCWLFWSQQGFRMLAWDGERWSLEPFQNHVIDSIKVQVVLDMQRALLLRIEYDAMKRIFWIWADFGRDRARWHLLRCALYFPTETKRGAALMSVGDVS